MNQPAATRRGLLLQTAHPLIQQLLRPVQPLANRINQLTRRDRMVMAVGLLAAALGVEQLAVQPLVARRQQIESTLRTDADQQRLTQADTALAQARQAATIQAELARQDQALAALGLQTTSRDTLASFLERGLPGQAVRLTAMKDLPVQPIAARAPDAGATAADSAATPPVPGSAAPTLYRHRVELQIEGTLPALTRALDVLEHQLPPLRIEQVRVVGHAQQTDTLQATVVLTVVNQERTWLML